jgi:hypothetical protein
VSKLLSWPMAVGTPDPGIAADVFGCNGYAEHLARPTASSVWTEYVSRKAPDSLRSCLT